jgi:hypothetical protein
VRYRSGVTGLPSLGDIVIYDPVSRVKRRPNREPWASRVGKRARVVFEARREDEAVGVVFEGERETVYPHVGNVRVIGR